MASRITKLEACKVLGVSDKSSEVEIKTAYRKLARLHHPDRDSNGAVLMSKINEAYERLTRSANEEDLVDSAPTPEEDVWGDFGDWETESDSNNNQNSKIGSHIYLTIDVAWEVANLGRNQVVTYKVNGVSKRITIKIPKGSSTGKKIRCRGKGNTPVNGGIAGDLIITLNVGVNSYSEEIRTSLTLKSSETKLPSVHTIRVVVDGSSKQISVPVPANVKNGQTVRVSGVGNRSAHGNSRGDIFVKITVIKSSPGADIETYAEIDSFLRFKMWLFNYANVTLRDVNTHAIINPSFRLEPRHANNNRYYWEDMGAIGDRGEQRGRLFVTPRFTEGAEQMVSRFLGVLALGVVLLVIIFAINNSSSQYSAESTDEYSNEQVVPESDPTPDYLWPPNGFELTDLDPSFAFAWAESESYTCDDSGVGACIQLEVAPEVGCYELAVRMRFYDSISDQEEWAEELFYEFLAGEPQTIQLSVYSEGMDSVDPPEIYCSSD